MIKSFQVWADRLTWYADAKRIPLTGSFELTPRCNLHCRMCYICNPEGVKRAELSAGQWLELMRDARDEGMLFALLTGGEPLIREDFWEIYHGARKLGLYITLNSNATCITPEVADALMKAPPLRVAVSVYGASPEGYRRVTGNAGAYDRMLSGIRLLKERGVTLRLRATLTKSILPEIREVTRLILAHSEVMSFSNYLIPGVSDNGNNVADERLTPEETADAMRIINEEVAAFKAGKGADADRSRDEELRQFDEDIKIPLDPEQEALHRVSLERRKNTAFYCQAGQSHFWVTYEGKLTACGLSREPAIELGTGKPFRQAFDELGTRLAAIPVCEDCRDCTYKQVCSPCPMKLFAETGSYDRKAEALCGYAKNSILLRE